jgi:hypothetical protein
MSYDRELAGFASGLANVCLYLEQEDSLLKNKTFFMLGLYQKDGCR